MEERIFFYDYYGRQWAEDRDAERKGEAAENMPMAYLRNHGETGESGCWGEAWCPEHRKWERITALSFHEMTTEAGCHVKGVIVKVGSGDGHVRWRVSYLPSMGTVTAIVDTACFSEMEMESSISSLTDLYTFAQKWHWKGVGICLSEKRQQNMGSNWGDLPQCVMEAVLDFLSDAAESIYGWRASVWHQPPPGKGDDWFHPVENAEQIKAFMKYPFDMRLHFLEDCLGRNLSDYGYGFRDSRESFPWLCYEFGLRPTQELWEDYEINPYRLRICAILRQLGIRSYGIMKRFYRLKEFCSTKWTSKGGAGNPDAIVFPRRFSDKQNFLHFQETFQINRFEPWQALVFYCWWRLSRSTEEDLADHLLELQERWTSYLSRSMVYFAQYFSCFPKDLRERIYREGFTEETHNHMVEIVNSGKTERTRFFHTEMEKEFECEIDGYVFRWLTSEEEFREFNRQYGRVWVEDQLRGKAIDLARTMLIFRKGEYQGCLCMGDRNFRIVAGDSRGHKVKVWVACLHWLKWTGLAERYHSYSEEDYAILDEAVSPKPLSVGENT